MKEYCDTNDYPCRYGGEEFAVIFSEKSLEEVERRMENALNKFKEHTFEFVDLNVAFSCGIAHIGVNDTSEHFFDRADRCLYYPKRNGKTA